MTTGKNIALTRWTFVGKVMSLLFNILSRLVIIFFQGIFQGILDVYTSMEEIGPCWFRSTNRFWASAIYYLECIGPPLVYYIHISYVTQTQRTKHIETKEGRETWDGLGEIGIDIHTLLVFFRSQVVSDTSWSHGMNHARFPCPSLPPWVDPSSCPLHRWCHPTISSSVDLFSFCFLI